MSQSVSFRQLVVPSAVLMLALGASAQIVEEETYGPQASEFLIGFNFAYAFADVDGVEFEDVSGRVNLGYFLTRNHELGLDLAGVYQATEDGGDQSRYFIGPVYNYNWYANPRTSFYGGGRVGLEYFNATGLSSETDFFWGLQLGLRRWLTPAVSFNVEPRYTRTEIDSASADSRDEFGLFLGFNVVL